MHRLPDEKLAAVLDLVAGGASARAIETATGVRTEEADAAPVVDQAAPEPRRCMAPLDDDEHLCGAPATEQRQVAGIVVDLCAEHAREFDEDEERPS